MKLNIKNLIIAGLVFVFFIALPSPATVLAQELSNTYSIEGSAITLKEGQVHNWEGSGIMVKVEQVNPEVVLVISDPAEAEEGGKYYLQRLGVKEVIFKDYAIKVEAGEESLVRLSLSKPVKYENTESYRQPIEEGYDPDSPRVRVVVAKNAGASDVILATNLIKFLHEKGIRTAETSLASDVSSLSQNLISIGSPCINTISQKILDNQIECDFAKNEPYRVDGYVRNGFVHILLIVNGKAFSDDAIKATVRNLQVSLKESTEEDKVNDCVYGCKREYASCSEIKCEEGSENCAEMKRERIKKCTEIYEMCGKRCQIPPACLVSCDKEYSKCSKIKWELCESRGDCGSKEEVTRQCREEVVVCKSRCEGSVRSPIRVAVEPTKSLKDKYVVKKYQEEEKYFPEPNGHCEDGCLADEKCIPYGLRFVHKNGDQKPMYCSIEGMQPQIEDGSACQNNHECLSNQCSNGKCVNFEAQLRETQMQIEETQNIIERFVDWVTNSARKLFRIKTPVKEARVMKEINKQIPEDFEDFANLPYSYENEVLEKAIKTGRYEERMFYNVFNELMFTSTAPTSECVENMETAKCIYYHAILNNREDLCEMFPKAKQVKLCGSTGCTQVPVNYKDSCAVYTGVFKIYSDARDKIAFCDSFTEDYVVRGCKQFVCFSQTPYGEEDVEGCKDIKWEDIR